jgi:hypothetical protein
MAAPYSEDLREKVMAALDRGTHTIAHIYSLVK